MQSQFSPTFHCVTHPKHQWDEKEENERKYLTLNRNINLVFRTDTITHIDNGYWFKSLCFLHFKASWTVWFRFNTNADKWSQLCWNFICICGCFSKTPSQIQSDVGASEGGHRRPGKNLFEEKVEKSVDYLPLTLIRSTIFFTQRRP